MWTTSVSTETDFDIDKVKTVKSSQVKSKFSFGLFCLPYYNLPWSWTLRAGSVPEITRPAS
jgi:hypothetical protein